MIATIRTAVVCAFLASALVQADVPSKASTPAYVDPRFADVKSAVVSTIITGEGAAQAVSQVGGRTTSDLWVIDAVAATIPTNAVEDIAAASGITSIVLNDIVKTADAGDAFGARIIKNQLTLADKVIAPGASLPNGGFVTVSEKGTITQYRGDGSVVRAISLSDATYATVPLVLADGTTVVINDKKRAFAVALDGSITWQTTLSGDGKVVAGFLAGPDDILYAIDEKNRVLAVNGADGTQRWTVSMNVSGSIKVAPVVGLDGSLYAATDAGTIFGVSPSGTRLWTTSVASTFTLKPLLAPNGLLYFTSTDAKRVLGVNPLNGSRKWIATAIGKIVALPIIADDGSFYFGTEDGYVYAFDSDGALLWRVRPSDKKMLTTPVLSRDGRTVYAAQSEGIVFAYDTATGLERWRFTLTGKILEHPVLDADNGLVIGTDDQTVARIDANGRATFRVKVQGKLSDAALVNSTGDAMLRLDDARVLTLSRMPETWDGTPDMQPTSDQTVWKTVNPATIDVGANIVHNVTTSGGKPLRGSGVTVAVVDSGIYFNKDVKSTQGLLLSKLFKGQADFVDPRCLTIALLMINLGLCTNSIETSVDPFGHGTAVSSIIWNNYTDYSTGTALGIAPDANVLSVRVLDQNGAGTYENVVKGIQFVVQNRVLHNIRIMNLSMSSLADVPYFVDPINRAVERAWASGIVVVAAAGNSGSNAETITAPGNDPYVITVGSINTQRTPGYWDDDTLPFWSATGPTRDGFVKPDLLASGANVVTFMYKDPSNSAASQRIPQMHPDYSMTTSLFRMNGTSMSTPIVSGIVALMLQNNPSLTPDQVKFRLQATARLSVTPKDDTFTYNVFQQGAGRVWAPDAVLGTTMGDGNPGMNLSTDLGAGYQTDADMALHYQGPTQKLLSDDGNVWLYYTKPITGPETWLGFASTVTMEWLDRDQLSLRNTTWNNGQMQWGKNNMRWEGGTSTDTDTQSDGSGRMSWGSGRMSWGSNAPTDPVAPTSWVDDW